MRVYIVRDIYNDYAPGDVDSVHRTMADAEDRARAILKTQTAKNPIWVEAWDADGKESPALAYEVKL